MADRIRDIDPGAETDETRYVDRMKAAISSIPRKGQRPGACLTFVLDYELRDQLRAAAAKHRMTMTQVLTYYIERVIPVLEKAEPSKLSCFRRDPSQRSETPSP